MILLIAIIDFMVGTTGWWLAQRYVLPLIHLEPLSYWQVLVLFSIVWLTCILRLMCKVVGDAWRETP